MSGVSAPLRLHDLIGVARVRGASDLHLESGVVPALRIDGGLWPINERAIDASELEELVRALVGGAQLPSFESDGDVSIAHEDPELGTLRVHAYGSARGLCVAVRLHQPKPPSLDALHLPPVVASFASLSRGLIVVAGPTGSGKSTTLAALIDRINDGSARRIVTIEDPVEYRHENRRSMITQREIGRDTPSLDRALRGVLRADPDVIVVGELRDAEAMHGALVAAETGHLVLTTLHTGDAAQTVDRICDAFAGTRAMQVRAQLAQVLAGVVCQHLVRRRGRDGRRALVEVLVATDAVRNLIRDGKTHQLRNAISTGRHVGMQTLEQHAADLARDGEIDPDEAAALR
jgi:twitching motility protein PilT